MLAWATKYMEKEMRYLGFDNKQMATLMMLQYWGTNTNTHKIYFWMLAYMLYEPGLLTSIREETDAVFVDDSLDLHTLEKSCPRLNGLWLEVLRFTVSTSSIRYVTEDVTTGGKRLRNGNMVINSLSSTPLGRVHRLDTKLAYPQRFPKGHDKTPDLGVFAPDQDLILCLT